MSLYRTLHAVVPPVAKAIWRPRVEGLEHVPATGGVLLASNHLSFVDSVVIPVVVPRKVVFLAKSDYFTGTGVTGALSRAWFEGLGMLPVDRDDPRAALGSLDTALEVLARGEAFGLYPEGTRSRDGRLYRGLVGTEKLQPVGSSVPRVVRVDVRFGAPIEVAGRFEGLASGKARRVLTDEVMDAIAGLTGQERAPGYNERAPDA